MPLSSLIELVDVVPKLHSYELSGRAFLWNWPITPHGARLLLSRSKKENEEERNGSCVLDKGEYTPPLHCIDMRWGDKYTCASPFTVRKVFESARLCDSIPATGEPFRLQHLNFIHIYRLDDPPHSVKPSAVARATVLGKILSINTVPWLAWVGAIAFCGVSGCWLAIVYLVILVMTGWIVRKLFGHAPRKLSFKRLEANKTKEDEKAGPKKRFVRCVLAADGFNETQWTLLYGDSDVVSSLTNLPLRKPSGIAPEPPTTILRLALYILIAVQWGLILAVSALQDWDAIIISIAIIACVCASAFIYTTNDSIHSWLQDNDIALEAVQVAFTGRRSMLSCLVALNPDDKTIATSAPPAPPREKKWINPILELSDDRRNWEAALDGAIRNGECVGSQWWVGAIVEGVTKANKIKEWIRGRQTDLDIAFENGF